MDVEIVNRQRRLRLSRPRIAALARTTFELENAGGGVSIAFVGRRAIIDLNRRFFGKDSDTDVIAFNLQDESGGDAGYVGEVVVCTHVAAEEAAARGIDPDDELCLYTVHGLLHLLGHDDNTPRKRAAMNRRARAIVRAVLNAEC